MVKATEWGSGYGHLSQLVQSDSRSVIGVFCTNSLPWLVQAKWFRIVGSENIEQAGQVGFEAKMQEGDERFFSSEKAFLPYPYSQSYKVQWRVFEKLFIDFRDCFDGMDYYDILACAKLRFQQYHLPDMLVTFPSKSVQLSRPFTIQPWKDSEENVGNLLMVWILSNDCGANSEFQYHAVAQKCLTCKSHHTRQTRGGTTPTTTSTTSATESQ